MINIKNCKNYKNNIKVEIKNDHYRVMCFSYNECVALTYLIYDGNIHIPCLTIEECGLVEAVSVPSRYKRLFVCRAIVKCLKAVMFPEAVRKYNRS